MGFSPDCSGLSTGMVVGPPFFGIFPGGPHLLDVGSSVSRLRSTLVGIWCAVGDYAADEPGPRGTFPVSFVMAGAAALAGSFAVGATGSGSDLILCVDLNSMDHP